MTRAPGKWKSRSSDDSDRNKQVAAFFNALAEHDNLASFELVLTSQRTGKPTGHAGVVMIAGPKEFADSMVRLIGAICEGTNKKAISQEPKP